MKGDYNSVKLSIPRFKSIITEAKENIEETKLDFEQKSKEELTEVTSEMSRIKESEGALEDKVNRTLVRSPVKGVVKQLLINTIGGVLKPGMDIVEIVPFQDKLLIEVKIKPSDIAYLYPGQRAIVKFTAYDFAIYGGLEGEVTLVSADTIVDPEGNSFYLIRIKTDKSYLERNDEKHEIIVGMVANVDIITGKKTVMDFILKPILKTKQGALTER
jgi:adhesin transport system membrane fusion protein